VDSIQTGAPTTSDADQDLTVETLLEDVSIDGMCGVY
jgi:mycofactocin precursor